MVTRRPHDYPWAVALREGVLDDRGFHERIAQECWPSGRSPVLASGSNASPDVLRDKLGPRLGGGADHQVPLTPVTVPGLGVGHSAHVSRPGYVAAAPYRARDAGAPPGATYALAWFTPTQLERLDETEPQYRRALLPDDLPVRTRSTGQLVPGAQLYISRHGLLAEDGVPLPLRSQQEVFDWLRGRLPCLQGRSMRAYDDPDMRERVRAELADGGWTAPSLLWDSSQA